MAALLPTILSDEEDENVIDTKKLGKKKVKKYDKVQIESDDEQSKASSGDEMDGDFEFGGMLVSDWLPRIFRGYSCVCVLINRTRSMCLVLCLFDLTSNANKPPTGRRWI